ncbi:MAG: MarR family transcriptional regulator [Candidatus Wallbacteria bacterium]|nr:MarR family transcriptional regulator [Candidatus Wallbacteria bacterium]
MSTASRAPTRQVAAGARPTRRQGEYLAFILLNTRKRGIAPSYDEIAAHFGTTTPSVNGMIKTLERNGFISRVPGAGRTLRVSASSIAAPSAIAVLDTMMPRLLSHGLSDREVIELVLEAAERLKASLEGSGVSDAEALAASRQVAAEASRWQPDGRGTMIPSRTWQKSR